MHGQPWISANTALRLTRFFGTSEWFWISPHAQYDLEAEKDRLSDTLDAIRPLRAGRTGPATRGGEFRAGPCGMLPQAQFPTCQPRVTAVPWWSREPAMDREPARSRQQLRSPAGAGDRLAGLAT